MPDYFLYCQVTGLQPELKQLKHLLPKLPSEKNYRRLTIYTIRMMQEFYFRYKVILINLVDNKNSIK
jgi:hypothetical protein